jgi:hypothetical protein
VSDGRCEIRVNIAKTDRQEMMVAKYMTGATRNTKRLSMNAWFQYYLVLALLETEGVEDREILEGAREAINQLQAQIGIIAMAVQAHGLELPAMSPVARGRAKPQQKAKKTKVEEEEFLDEPPMMPLAAALEFNMDN